jgi:hypothetical protein
MGKSKGNVYREGVPPKPVATRLHSQPTAADRHPQLPEYRGSDRGAPKR